MGDDVRPLAGRSVDDLGPTQPDHAPGPVVENLTRGSAVGRYLVLEWLGEGGMGVVYAAYDPQLDRKIALKVVRHGGTAGDSARMGREAQALAKLAHPNVVAVHDVGTTADGHLFIAMELVDGCTLAAWLALEPRSTDDILHMFAQAGRGLAAAHRAGLVHRDFKPDNVLVGKDGRARVVDFGLVRATQGVPDDDVPGLESGRSPSDDVVTQAGALMGTLLYMAPEQVMQGLVDARTDQYSFCVSLYEALGDVRPFAGDSFQEIAEAILAGKVAAWTSSRKVPPHVREAIKRGMSREPDDRFPTLDELLAVLTRQDRTRQRTVIALAAAIVVGGIAAMVWLRHAADTSQCGNAADQLATAWGPGRRAMLEHAFTATNLPFAQAELAATERALDDYAHAWTATYEDSCKATHVRHEQSPDMLDLRTACLRDKRTALATLVDLLATADKTLVQSAHRSVADLPPIADCDASVLAAPVKPRDALTAAVVANQREVLATTRAMFNAGKYRDALPRVEAVYATARVVGYGPLIAEASEQLAKHKSKTGDIAGGTRAFIEAFSAAAAGHSDHDALSLAIHIGGILADQQAFDQAHTWLDAADMFANRLDSPPTERARIHFARGYVLAEEGKFAAALSEYERAAHIREQAEPNSLRLGMALLGVARMNSELGRFDEARAVAERSLALQQAVVGPDHPEMSTVLNTVANIAVDQGDYDAAERYYQRAHTLLEPTPGTFIGDPATAAHAINNLGGVAFNRGHYDEALVYHRRALAIYERSPARAPDVALTLGNIGGVLHARGDTTDALAAFERSLAVAEASLGADHPYVGDALVGIGACRVKLRQFAEARPVLERALAIRSRGARPNEVADVQLELAKALWALGDRTRAIELAQAARAGYAKSPTSKEQVVEAETWLREASSSAR
ncbi:MAG TPA: serine/threonine-protein kinase [Kofleriaceae bacterium]|nr:serine/threonine-protein kinase [Kofleriaceae bacterium]